MYINTTIYMFITSKKLTVRYPVFGENVSASISEVRSF